jgi:RNA polymerase sigma-70 factor (ECF subfamily)
VGRRLAGPHWTPVEKGRSGSSLDGRAFLLITWPVPRRRRSEQLVPRTQTAQRDAEDQAVVAAATAGDEAAFAALTERYRRELHVHCYRMLGSFDEAEDLLQETFLRAWRARESFEGGQGFRAWLYRIATNACLDTLRRNSRRVKSVQSFAEVPWIQPYPDRLLDEIAPDHTRPDAVVVAKETIELAFLATIQLLPPKQRAVLILRDVLDYSAAETASLLDLTVAASNSALQRARVTLRERGPDRGLASSMGEPTDQERVLVERLIEAHEKQDAAAAIALMREDIRIAMPPYPWRFDGLAEFAPLLQRTFGPDSAGDWRLVPTRANRQPAAGSYLRATGDTEFRAFKIDVMRFAGGLVAEITTFGPSLFPEFGLPPTLDQDS